IPEIDRLELTGTNGHLDRFDLGVEVPVRVAQHEIDFGGLLPRIVNRQRIAYPIVVDDGRKDPAGRGRWDRWRRRDPGRGRHLVGFPYRWERIAVTIEALNTSEHDPTRSCRQVGGEVIT